MTSGKPHRGAEEITRAKIRRAQGRQNGRQAIRAEEARQQGTRAGAGQAHTAEAADRDQPLSQRGF